MARCFFWEIFPLQQLPRQLPQLPYTCQALWGPSSFGYGCPTACTWSCESCLTLIRLIQPLPHLKGEHKVTWGSLWCKLQHLSTQQACRAATLGALCDTQVWSQGGSTLALQWPWWLPSFKIGFNTLMGPPHPLVGSLEKR